jgi:hypothetical protein
VTANEVPANAPALTLEPPDLGNLPSYVAALERGWSPNNTRDVSAEQVALSRASPKRMV